MTRKKPSTLFMHPHITHILERITAYGNAVECSCCGKRARRFFPSGVVNKRPYARCAFCGSLERHRLIAEMLKRHPIAQGSRILVIAPEKPLTDFLEKNFSAKITTSDLLRTDVDVQADICALPFTDASFDVVLANHVLEHIPDDRLAMRELWRVTINGGRAIMQTPLAWQNPSTDEDPTLNAKERITRYGQDDHVRLYGCDILERFTEAGWKAEATSVTDLFSESAIVRYGFEKNEMFFMLKKQHPLTSY